jgi:signal peptidase I
MALVPHEAGPAPAEAVGPAAGSFVGTVAAPGDAAPTNGDGAAKPNGTAAGFGQTRRFDYRLRGLELGTVSAEAPPRLPPRYRPDARKRRRLLVKWFIFLALGATVAVLLRAEVVEPFTVTSPSMVPTLQVGDRILVLRSAVLPGAMKFGDIVVFHRPASAVCSGSGDQAKDLVKRVIALPGQRIWSVGDTIYVNGRRLDEPGWYNPPYGHLGPTPIVATTVPPGAYFVMGDNRTDTCDSRLFGAVPSSLVVGKVVTMLLRSGHPHVHVF